MNTIDEILFNQTEEVDFDFKPKMKDETKISFKEKSAHQYDYIMSTYKKLNVEEVGFLSFIKENMKFTVSLEKFFEKGTIEIDPKGKTPSILGQLQIVYRDDIIERYISIVKGDDIRFGYILEDFIRIVKDVFNVEKVYTFDNVNSYNIETTEKNGQTNTCKFLNGCTFFIAVKDDKGGVYFILSQHSHRYDMLSSKSDGNTVYHDKVSCVDSGFAFIYNNVTNDEATLKIEQLSEKLKDCDFYYSDIKKKHSKRPFYNLIRQTQNGWAIKEIIGKKDMDFPINLHYGEDFVQFHEKLKYSLVNKDTGLVLFRGPSGTGKTHYIKHLATDMKDTHMFLILKPNMFAALSDPTFQEFLMETNDYHSEKLVLVIEDAESLLVARDGIRTIDLSVLLNFTDGIDSEICPMQIICTFNTDISKIDSALTREGRLIADKYFGLLSMEESNKLLEHLVEKNNIKKAPEHITEQKSLSHIYKLVETCDENMLNGYSDENKSKRVKVGF
jgi:hypothetical protein